MRRIILALGALILLTGCGSAPSNTAGLAPAAARPAAAATCANATQTYDPASTTDIANGSTMAAIKKRGHLVVGVSADTYRMGSRNPFTGQIEGFDIDAAKQVATAIFGDAKASRIQFRVITASQRLTLLESKQVDLVARTFSITCDRWKDIAFSAEYLRAGQKVLVSSNSTAKSIADLDGERVCAPAGTTSVEKLADYPKITVVTAADHTGCLVKFQRGLTDAITGDDTVLAGLAAQDPYAKVVGPAFSAEPYGLGVNADQVDFVRFINLVLATWKSNGGWAKSYDTWLSSLGPAPTPPVAVYGRS